MAGKLTRSIELTTNIAIIIVAVLLSIVLVKQYLLPRAGPDASAPNSPPTVPIGTKVSLQDVNWAAKKRTLVMVLSDSCRYLLDVNVFIQAKRLHYGMDFCPAFWEWLIAKNASKEVFSIERVGDELLAGGDELAN